MKTRIETTSTLPSYHVEMRRIMILRIDVDPHITNRCNIPLNEIDRPVWQYLR